MRGTRGTSRRRRRAVAPAVLGTLVLLAVGSGVHAAEAGRIERIDFESDGPAPRVVIHLSRPLAFDVRVLERDPARQTPRRLVLDFGDTTLAPAATKPIAVSNDVLRQIRSGQFDARTARVVLELGGDARHAIEAFESPPHVTIALAGSAVERIPGADAKPAAPVSDERRPSVAAGDAPKEAVRTIPIRARGRKPYSLNYSR